MDLIVSQYSNFYAVFLLNSIKALKIINDKFYRFSNKVIQFEQANSILLGTLEI